MRDNPFLKFKFKQLIQSFRPHIMRHVSIVGLWQVYRVYKQRKHAQVLHYTVLTYDIQSSRLPIYSLSQNLLRL
jgi:hypothetical protein